MDDQPEADWNVLLDQPGAAEGPLAYWYSKAAAEQAAVEAESRQDGSPGARPRWRLVSLLPGSVWGPPLSARADGESVQQMMRLINGGMPVFAPPLGAGLVDVRDVAAAHCLALAQPQLRGRFLLSARSCYTLLLASK
ncbi:heme peroxidase-related protein, partial [Haematococcus lacustris]